MPGLHQGQGLGRNRVCGHPPAVSDVDGDRWPCWRPVSFETLWPVGGTGGGDGELMGVHCDVAVSGDRGSGVWAGGVGTDAFGRPAFLCFPPDVALGWKDVEEGGSQGWAVGGGIGGAPAGLGLGASRPLGPASLGPNSCLLAGAWFLGPGLFFGAHKQGSSELRSVPRGVL